MQPDLPENYYLDNVLILFEHVTRVYADILDSRQLGFLQDFDGLGEDAKKLCIRLLNRNHDWFRAGKLDYAEIGSLDAAIDELAQNGFLEVDGEIEKPVLLSLFTKPELLSCADDSTRLAKLRRSELDHWLLERAQAGFFRDLQARDSLLHLLCREQYQLCQMLFFGNLNQSMTDFVLRDLGLYQFESYHIDHRHRPYRNSLEIQQHWLLHQLEMLFEIGDATDPRLLAEIIDMIPVDIDSDSPAYRKSERLRYEVARQMERLGDLPVALDLYRRCRLPPSRERITRILDRQGDHPAALRACCEIIAQPLDEEEFEFGRGFANRLVKRHGLDAPKALNRQDDARSPEIDDLELAQQDSVEIAVAEHYNAIDRSESCYYLENSLFNGVLGLLIWDVVFADRPGAFFNPFQYRPSDFYAPDFCASRHRLLTQTWASIDGNDDIWRIVTARWEQKHGLMNPLVNWQDLDLDIIALALERIDFAHWRAVFERILADLRNHRSGFPDLVRFPPEGGYCLIEVKGPGDSLQKNQQRWMQYFYRHGIPHRLARVTWRTD